MAKAGDEFVNPVTRLRTVFRKTAQDASVAQLHVDWIGDPGCRYSGYFQDLDGHLWEIAWNPVWAVSE
jgi:predicted lactoylglutathione lyase